MTREVDGPGSRCYRLVNLCSPIRFQAPSSRPRPRSDLSGHLGALQDYFVSNGVIPSLTELGKLWGIAGRAWTHRVVARLKEEGFLEEAAGKRLKPGARFFERTVADTVRAGLPQPANDSGRE